MSNLAGRLFGESFSAREKVGHQETVGPDEGYRDYESVPLPRHFAAPSPLRRGTPENGFRTLKTR
jgi:hypothetical protein